MKRRGSMSAHKSLTKWLIPILCVQQLLRLQNQSKMNGTQAVWRCLECRPSKKVHELKQVGQPHTIALARHICFVLVISLFYLFLLVRCIYSVFVGYLVLCVFTCIIPCNNYQCRQIIQQSDAVCVSLLDQAQWKMSRAADIFFTHGTASAASEEKVARLLAEKWGFANPIGGVVCRRCGGSVPDPSSVANHIRD